MKNSVIHLSWTIFVLLALLIGSLSVSWSTLPDIPNIVSIALGLSSLMLAIIAIVQALTGSTTLSMSLSKIEVAAQRALDATGSVEAAAKALDDRASLLEGVPTSLELINQKIDDFNSTPPNKSSPDNPPAVTHDFDHDQLIEVYNGSTNGIRLAFYMAAKASKAKKSFDPTSIVDHKYISGVINGSLLMLRYVGLIKMNYLGGNFEIEDMDTKLRDHVLNSLPNQVSDSEFILEYTSKIDSFFDPKHPVVANPDD